jgi:hypothetical protein
MYNMPIVVPNILLHRGLLLRHVLDICKSPLDFTLGKDSVAGGCNDVNKAKKFTQKIQLVHQVNCSKLEFKSPVWSYDPFKFYSSSSLCMIHTPMEEIIIK